MPSYHNKPTETVITATRLIFQTNFTRLPRGNMYWSDVVPITFQACLSKLKTSQAKVLQNLPLALRVWKRRKSSPSTSVTSCSLSKDLTTSEKDFLSQLIISLLQIDTSHSKGSKECVKSGTTNYLTLFNPLSNVCLLNTPITFLK